MEVCAEHSLQPLYSQEKNIYRILRTLGESVYKMKIPIPFGNRTPVLQLLWGQFWPTDLP